MSGMPSIPNAFQQLVEDLALTEVQREKADRQQRTVRDALSRGIELDRAQPSFLTGSFARGTAIRRLKDIDMFAVLDAERYRSLVRRPAQVALDEIHQVLDAAYPNKVEPAIQDHTVRVDFKSTHTSFEVAPALRLEDGAYLIPRKRTGLWIKSNPRKHAEITRRANARTSGDASVLIKLAKHFKRVVGDRGKIASFHLEMMICELLERSPSDYPTGLRDLFDRLAARVQRPFPDPAGVGPDIDDRLTPADRQRLQAIFGGAARTAARAVELAEQDPAGAHWLWRDLLGDIYPVPGRKPSDVPGARPFSVDAPTRRFG